MKYVFYLNDVIEAAWSSTMASLLRLAEPPRYVVGCDYERTDFCPIRRMQDSHVVHMSEGISHQDQLGRMPSGSHWQGVA